MNKKRLLQTQTNTIFAEWVGWQEKPLYVLHLWNWTNLSQQSVPANLVGLDKQSETFNCLVLLPHMPELFSQIIDLMSNNLILSKSKKEQIE